ncbi:MAG: FAD dependent oxidoreductase [Bacteroidetes bacterium]|nr:MAG: FAD dependent oxidoreductase [Bacteroidota bacterium]
MGFKTITVKVPTDYTDEMLRKSISKELHIKQFSFQIENKSLDARNKSAIHWLLSVGVFSEEIKGAIQSEKELLSIPNIGKEKEVVVVGNGPAGFFCAYVLQKAGFKVIMIDRGSEVEKRSKGIEQFEQDGVFNPLGNYAFGEGGAGTFSDGKLTSRSKHISIEKQFILSSYVEAGAPREIEYMAHPHLGTDNLKKIVKNLRLAFQKLGGTMTFETTLTDIRVKDGRVEEVITDKGSYSPVAVFIAPGHSAYETYRMLLRRGVAFRTKNFALGSRMEHQQDVINIAQWGKPRLPGVKAAEYRLTSAGDGKHQVYSFCMCPGGMVVPATAYEDTNIVNGMSYFKRDGHFANAACVAGIHPDVLASKSVSPLEALDLVEQLERKFFSLTQKYAAPACNIRDFIDQKLRTKKMESSYPLGVEPLPLWQFLPESVTQAMKAGLLDFDRKMQAFTTGNLLGLESKTSSPIQVLREEGGRCVGFTNLFMMGEGSGYAGGIISSAADGVRTALHFVSQA